VKIRVLPLAFTLAMATAGAVQADEVIATSCLFNATLNGGSSYHLDALYSGSIDASQWEDVAGSTPIHPSDELWCHWKIQSRITRKLLFVDEPGVERALDTMPPTDVWYSATIYGEGGPSQAAARQLPVSKVITITPSAVSRAISTRWWLTIPQMPERQFGPNFLMYRMLI
jgi:hypothetical protein